MSAGHFLQFPLCVLAMKHDPKGIANYILSYGMVAAGRAVLLKFDPDKRVEKCEIFKLSKKKVDSWELAAHLGGEQCNMTVGSAEASVTRYHAAAAHVEKWESKYGTSPLVRLTTNIVFELRDGGQISWREFRVLAGLYSVIGAKPFPVIIPLSMIEARHCGFSNQAGLEKGRTAKDCPEALTMKQLRGTVQKLWELKWFARVTPDPHGRATYYSNRMSEDEMREKIFKTRTYKTGFTAERLAKNKELAERIKAAKGTFNSKDEKGTFNSGSPDADNSGKNGHHSGTDGASEGHHEGSGKGTEKGTMRAPIIETPLIETLSIETPSIETHSNTNTQNRNPNKDSAAIAAEVVFVSEKKVVEPEFTQPSLAQWTAYVKAKLPKMISGGQVPAWSFCRSVHADCAKWISTGGEGF